MNLLSRLAFALCLILAISLPVRGESPQDQVKKIVETFYRDYYKAVVEKPAKDDPDAQIINFVNRNPSCSLGFRRALEKAMKDARAKDPTMGLGSDPILGGQDHPEKGYEARTINITKNRGSLEMVGIGGGHFRISVGMINPKGRWLINSINHISGN